MSYKEEEKKRFLPQGTSLMSLIYPSIEIPRDITSFIHNEVRVSQKQTEKGIFFEIILENDLFLIIEEGKMSKLDRCKCRIPVLANKTIDSVNKAHRELLNKFSPEKTNTRSVYESVYCKEDNEYWEPLKFRRSNLDPRLNEIIKLRQSIKKIIKDGNVELVASIFSGITPEDLQRISALIGIDNLRSAINFWEKNQENDDEECWQVFLKNNSYVISQAFLSPIIILEDKAYVGGKGIGNKNGNLLDFLFVHGLNANATLIEIKTPRTPLIGSIYRRGAYSISQDLSGSITQILNYKDSITKEYNSLIRSSPNNFQVFNPKCVVIAGRISTLRNEEQSSSFELFRNNLKDVQIVTYDELFKKIEMLLNLLSYSEVSESNEH